LINAQYLEAIMTERTSEQVNFTLDRIQEMMADFNLSLNRLEGLTEQTTQAVQDFIQSAKPRLLSLETSREQQEDILEELQNNKLRMERAHLEHQSRLDRADEMIARMDRQHLEHQEQSAQLRTEHQERTAQLRAEHQERLDRQDQLLERLINQQRS
jgi:hypothetical protein